MDINVIFYTGSLTLSSNYKDSEIGAIKSLADVKKLLNKESATNEGTHKKTEIPSGSNYRNTDDEKWDVIMGLAAKGHHSKIVFNMESFEISIAGDIGELHDDYFTGNKEDNLKGFIEPSDKRVKLRGVPREYAEKNANEILAEINRFNADPRAETPDGRLLDGFNVVLALQDGTQMEIGVVDGTVQDQDEAIDEEQPTEDLDNTDDLGMIPIDDQDDDL